MKNILSTLGIALAMCLMLVLHASQAQTAKDSTQKKPLQKIITKKGNVLYGRIIKSGKESVTIQTTDIGIITLKMSNIAKIETTTGTVPTDSHGRIPFTREHWYRHGMYNNKYFIGTNGFNLKKNEVYIESVFFATVGARWGITDNLSIGAGGFITGQFFFGNSKLTIPVGRNFRLGASLNWWVVPTVGDLGLLSLAGTYGSKDYNISAGLSYGVLDGEITPRPLINLGGMARPINRVAFVGELILLPVNTQFNTFTNSQRFLPLAMMGTRFINKKSSIDFSFLYLNSGEINGSSLILLLPYIAYRHKI